MGFESHFFNIIYFVSLSIESLTWLPAIFSSKQTRFVYFISYFTSEDTLQSSNNIMYMRATQLNTQSRMIFYAYSGLDNTIISPHVLGYTHTGAQKYYYNIPHNRIYNSLKVKNIFY